MFAEEVCADRRLEGVGVRGAEVVVATVGHRHAGDQRRQAGEERDPGVEVRGRDGGRLSDGKTRASDLDDALREQARREVAQERFQGGADVPGDNAGAEPERLPIQTPLAGLEAAEAEELEPHVALLRPVALIVQKSRVVRISPVQVAIGDRRQMMQMIHGYTDRSIHLTLH